MRINEIITCIFLSIALEPYNKIVGELPDMRKEAVVLIRDAIGHNRRAYVLVNNRLEGNAPLTVQSFYRPTKIRGLEDASKRRFGTYLSNNWFLVSGKMNGIRSANRTLSASLKRWAVAGGRS